MSARDGTRCAWRTGGCRIDSWPGKGNDGAVQVPWRVTSSKRRSNDSARAMYVIISRRGRSACGT